MKRILVGCLVLMSLGVTSVQAYVISRTLYLQRVKVEAITAKQIKLSGVPYTIGPSVKVGKYDFTRGDEYKGPANLYDVRVGDIIYARVDGTTVIEIMIERK